MITDLLLVELASSPDTLAGAGEYCTQYGRARARTPGPRARRGMYAVTLTESRPERESSTSGHTTCYQSYGSWGYS